MSKKGAKSQKQGYQSSTIIIVWSYAFTSEKSLKNSTIQKLQKYLNEEGRLKLSMIHWKIIIFIRKFTIFSQGSSFLSQNFAFKNNPFSFHEFKKKQIGSK